MELENQTNEHISNQVQALGTVGHNFQASTYQGRIPNKQFADEQNMAPQNERMANIVFWENNIFAR